MKDFILQEVATIDFQILYFIQEHLRCTALDAVMPVITYSGSAGIIWIITAFILIMIKKYRVCGMKMLIGMMAGLIIGNLLLKNLIARERPCWIDTELQMLIPVPHDYSFPSGHTTASVISAVMLMQETKKLGIPACILASLIAFSRMYLFVHFPTDILGGLILGLIIGLSVNYIWNRISASKKETPSS